MGKFPAPRSLPRYLSTETRGQPTGRPRQIGRPVRNLHSVRPHSVDASYGIPALHEPPKERALAAALDERALRDEDHTTLAARKHHVHAVVEAQEARLRRAYGGDDDVWRLVTYAVRCMIG